MGWIFLSATGTVYTGQGVLKGFVVNQLATRGASAHLTLYNATAATAAKKIIHTHVSSAEHCVPVNINGGILFDNLYGVLSSATATIWWD
jgi:hypothetical protein